MEIGVDGYCEVGGRYLREVPVLFVLVLAQSVEQIEHLGQEGRDLGGQGGQQRDQQQETWDNDRYICLRLQELQEVTEELVLRDLVQPSNKC